MKQVALTLLLFLAVASAASDFENKTEAEFIKIRDQCMKQVNISKEQSSKVEDFVFADVKAVREVLHCIWTNMKLWDDKNGFNVEHIAHLYSDKVNADELTQKLKECNKNNENLSELEWMYRAFMCIMDGSVGTFFKEDVQKHLETA